MMIIIIMSVLRLSLFPLNHHDSAWNLAALGRLQTSGCLPSDTKRQVRPLQGKGRHLISLFHLLSFSS